MQTIAFLVVIVTEFVQLQGATGLRCLSCIEPSALYCSKKLTEVRECPDESYVCVARFNYNDPKETYYKCLKPIRRMEGNTFESYCSVIFPSWCYCKTDCCNTWTAYDTDGPNLDGCNYTTTVGTTGTTDIAAVTSPAKPSTTKTPEEEPKDMTRAKRGDEPHTESVPSSGGGGSKNVPDQYGTRQLAMVVLLVSTVVIFGIV